MAKNPYQVREEGRGTSLADYWPLAALVLVAALAATALVAGAGVGGMTGWMHFYMGIFLVVFALLKLFDPEGFKDGFAMYDLIAKRLPAHGYVYPWIELGLGLAYLAFLAPPLVYGLTILVFAVGAVGVIGALREGLDIECPCMGNVLAVPLSTVTLTEDVLMIVMAAVLLVAPGGGAA